MNIRQTLNADRFLTGSLTGSFSTPSDDWFPVPSPTGTGTGQTGSCEWFLHPHKGEIHMPDIHYLDHDPRGIHGPALADLQRHDHVHIRTSDRCLKNRDGEVYTPRHDPTFLNAKQHGRWCVCSCGWDSGDGSPMNAQLAFGRHLLECSAGQS